MRYIDLYREIHRASSLVVSEVLPRALSIVLFFLDNLRDVSEFLITSILDELVYESLARRYLSASLPDTVKREPHFLPVKSQLADRRPSPTQSIRVARGHAVCGYMHVVVACKEIQLLGDAHSGDRLNGKPLVMLTAVCKTHMWA